MAQCFTMDSGLQVVVEQLPCRSVACGVWVRAGSAWEQPTQGGVSHFLEHMLFKGTQRRNAQEIAAVMDAVGGMVNAFTGKEYTCYYTRSLDEHLELSLDLLADLYLAPKLAEEDFQMEKNVIIEEINMYEDAPADLVDDLFTSTLWPAHPYGLSILGSQASIQDLSHQSLQNYYQQNYAPSNTVIAIAGNITPDQAYQQVERYFSGFSGASSMTQNAEPKPAGGSAYIYKDIEQMHVCLGFPAVADEDADYYAAHILNSILGSGMSSRLFQEIREKRGLSYSALSYLASHAQAGYYCAYASTRPQNLTELAKVMANEFTKAVEKGLSDQELKMAQQQIKGNLLLGLENSGNVMNRLGKRLLTVNKLFAVEETLAQVMAVTPADLERVARRILDPTKAVLAVVGPLEEAVNFNEIW